MDQPNYPWYSPFQLYAKPERSLIITHSQSFAMRDFAFSVAKHYLQARHIDEHPDFLLIDSQNKASISVETVRSVTAQAGLTARSNNGRVLMVDQAEKLTTSAGNALLKILEEPPSGLLCLLVCETSESLLSTLRSRCEIVAPKTCSQEELIDWLSRRIGDSKQAELLLSMSYNKPINALEKIENNTLEHFQQRCSAILQVFENPAHLVDYAQHFTGNREEFLQELEYLLLLIISALRVNQGSAHAFSHLDEVSKLVKYLSQFSMIQLSDATAWVASVNHDLNIITGLRVDWAATQLMLRMIEWRRAVA